MPKVEKLPKPLWRRILRRTAIVAGALLLFVTLASLLFNALTQLPDTLAAPSGYYTEVNGERIHYQKWGTTGPPIVLVHGFLESTVSWSQVAPLLAKGNVVYAIDLAGFGYSQFDGKYSLNDEEHLVDGFMQQFHLRRPILVGHSLGAAVVGDVALEDPQNVGGVIFADGDGLPFSAPNGTIRSAIVGSPYFTSIYRLLLHTHSLDLRLFKGVCGPSCGTATPQLLASWLRPLHQAGEEQALKAMAANGVAGITPQQVAAIKVPHGIIWGQYDDSDGGSLSGAITNLHHPQTIIIPKAGHLSMVANPSAFAAAVKAEMLKMTQ